VVVVPSGVARVLLIEDDADVLATITMLLEMYGFDVVGSATTREARTELERGAFEIVLADLMVDSLDPVRSRNDLAQLVRLAAPTPVGMFTGYLGKNTPIDEHGLAFTLIKPFPSELLLAKLAAAFESAPVTESHHARIRDYFGCLEHADWERLVAGCTVDVVYQLPSDHPRFGRTIRGRAAFRELAAATFRDFVEPRFTIDAIRPLPRGVIVQFQGSWLARDGTRQSIPGSVLFVFDGDLIAEIGVRLDVPALHAVLAS